MTVEPCAFTEDAGFVWPQVEPLLRKQTNCKAGSPLMAHLVLRLQNRGVIQATQHTETDPSSIIHKECFGKYEKWGRGVTDLESGAAYRNRTDTSTLASLQRTVCQQLTRYIREHSVVFRVVRNA